MHVRACFTFLKSVKLHRGRFVALLSGRLRGGCFVTACDRHEIRSLRSFSHVLMGTGLCVGAACPSRCVLILSFLVRFLHLSGSYPPSAAPPPPCMFVV